jgi:uncharacterized protein DUF3617
MKLRLIAPLIPLAVIATAASAAEIQPGLWEITTKMEMPGMPQSMPAHTMRHCYTKKDVENGKSTVPQSEDKNCQIKNYKVSGDTITWSMECTGEHAMTTDGTMTVGATTYTGTMKSKMKQDGKTVEMNQTMAAKRVGECK